MQKIKTNVVVVNDNLIALKLNDEIVLYEKKEVLEKKEIKLNNDIDEIKQHLEEFDN